MNDVELQAILEEMRRLKTRVALLESALKVHPEADEIVGKEYVAERFGIPVTQVENGKHGTAGIPRVSIRPMKFKKSDVEAAWRKRNKPASELALEEIHRAKGKRRVKAA